MSAGKAPRHPGHPIVPFVPEIPGESDAPGNEGCLPEQDGHHHTAWDPLSLGPLPRGCSAQLPVLAKGVRGMAAVCQAQPTSTLGTSPTSQHPESTCNTPGNLIRGTGHFQMPYELFLQVGQVVQATQEKVWMRL